MPKVPQLVAAARIQTQAVWLHALNQDTAHPREKPLRLFGDPGIPWEICRVLSSLSLSYTKDMQTPLLGFQLATRQ